MMTTPLVPLTLGFLLGLKHALDADHLVAVSTIVSEHKSLVRSSMIGAVWGLGHTTSLFITGIAVVLFRLTIPENVAQWMEFAVAIMLIVLGANILRKDWQAAPVHLHEHQHEGHTHTHFHLHVDESHTAHHAGVGPRPFLIGMVHGLAGSAALMLLVLAQISSPYIGLLYILIFGIGSIGGMLIMSTMIALPFVVTARRFGTLNRRIRVLAGLFSIGFGAFLVWKIGITEGLFKSLIA